MAITRHKISNCPKCRRVIDSSACLYDDAAKPKENDATVCLRCGQILLYNADLTVRIPTSKELKELMKNDIMWKHISDIKFAVWLRDNRHEG